MSKHANPAWLCPFCGSRRLFAWFRWATLDTNKLHVCKARGEVRINPAIADYSGMEPRKDPRQPIFRDHNCGGCDSGRLPCREGNYNSCSNPRARND